MQEIIELRRQVSAQWLLLSIKRVHYLTARPIHTIRWLAQTLNTSKSSWIETMATLITLVVWMPVVDNSNKVWQLLRRATVVEITRMLLVLLIKATIVIRSKLGRVLVTKRIARDHLYVWILPKYSLDHPGLTDIMMMVLLNQIAIFLREEVQLLPQDANHHNT